MIVTAVCKRSARYVDSRGEQDDLR